MIQLLAWILFSLLEGMREAASFSHGNSKHPFNIHKYFMPVRALFALILCMWSGMWVDLIAYMLIFSFFHDGAYYQTRHFIDYPKYNFFSQSESTTAKFSVNFKVRTIMLILGTAAFYLLRLI